MTNERAQDIISEILTECNAHPDSCTGCPFNKTDNKYSGDCGVGEPWRWRWEDD